jgi:hypothetical protein
MLRHLVTYHLLAILLVSRIGIPVYSHVCHNVEGSWTSLYMPANACCSWTFMQSSRGCCKTAVSTGQAQVKQVPCCENRSGFLAINSAFALLTKGLAKSQAQLLAETPIVVDQWIAATAFNRENSHSAPKTHGPPAGFHGRSLLISQRVFRC